MTIITVWTGNLFEIRSDLIRNDDKFTLSICLHWSVSKRSFIYYFIHTFSYTASDTSRGISYLIFTEYLKLMNELVLDSATTAITPTYHFYRTLYIQCICHSQTPMQKIHPLYVRTNVNHKNDDITLLSTPNHRVGVFHFSY